jgi:hypothetical protein
MSRWLRGNEVEFVTTIELPKVRDERGRFTSETEDVEVTVRACVTPPTKPTLRADPDDCDPGDPGEFEVLSVTRNDTGEDITNSVDHDQFEDRGFEQAKDDEQGAYEAAMEARADAARERAYFGED